MYKDHKRSQCIASRLRRILHGQWQDSSHTKQNFWNSNFVWLAVTTFVVLCITLCAMPSVPMSTQSVEYAHQNNLESIAILIVAYRGTSCIGAIETALSMATHPNRLSFFVANAGWRADSVSCLSGYDDLTDSGSEVVEKHIRSVFEMESELFGMNAVKSALVRTQLVDKQKTFDFVLEVHAHSLFAHGWDAEILSEWKLTRNKNGILSTNPSRASEMSARQFDHHRGKTMNIICAAKFAGSAVLYDHPWEIKPPLAANGAYAPMEIPFWSSFMSFGPFHYLSNVPYDPLLKAVTEDDGSDFVYSARLRTSGYKMYAPNRDLVFYNYRAHHFERKYKVKRDKALLRKDAVRMNQLLRRAHASDEYGMGSNLTLSRYLKIVGVNVKQNTTKSLCALVRDERWHS